MYGPADASEESGENHKLLFRKRYMPYYLVTLAYGCQKRIKIVFAPWVIINLLGQGADTVALLTIAVHLAGGVGCPCHRQAAGPAGREKGVCQ